MGGEGRGVCPPGGTGVNHRKLSGWAWKVTETGETHPDLVLFELKDVDVSAVRVQRKTECRLVLVFCHEGLRQQPAHGHRPTPCCACGWIGEEHTSQLMARREWETHLSKDVDE